MQAISRDDLKEMNEAEHRDFVLINVLPREAFCERHIRTSINLPHERPSFCDDVELVAGSKAREIVVYCASFSCDASPKAGKKLEEQGFTNVYDYEGGTADWFEQKREA